MNIDTLLNLSNKQNNNKIKSNKSIPKLKSKSNKHNLTKTKYNTNSNNLVELKDEIGNFDINGITLALKNLFDSDNNENINQINNINLSSNSEPNSESNLESNFKNKNITKKSSSSNSHKNKTNNLKNKSTKILNKNKSKKKYINRELEINGDCFINDNLYLKNNFMASNAFFNQNIFINNSLNLPSEKIKLNYDFIDLNTNNFEQDKFYNFMLENMINSTKNLDLTSINFSSIKFYSEKNKYILPSIINISKKFVIDDEIFLGTGLFYVIFIKNKIIVSKLINDTFVILNKKYEPIIENKTTNIKINQNNIISNNNIQLSNTNNYDDFNNDLNNNNLDNNNFKNSDDSDDSDNSNDSDNSDNSDNLDDSDDSNCDLNNLNEKNSPQLKNNSNDKMINLNEYVLNILTSSIDENSINSILQKLSSNDIKKK